MGERKERKRKKKSVGRKDRKGQTKDQQTHRKTKKK